MIDESYIRDGLLVSSGLLLKKWEDVLADDRCDCRFPKIERNVERPLADPFRDMVGVVCHWDRTCIL